MLRSFWAAGRRAAPVPTLAVCVAVGVVGGAVLVGRPPGIGAAVVGMLVCAAAVPVVVRRRRFGDLALLVLGAALLAVVAVRTAGWVVALCVVAACWVAVVATASARTAPSAVLAPVTAALGAVRAVPWVRHGAGAALGGRRHEAVTVLRSAAITVGLLVVFGALFASADRVFASLVPQVHVDRLPGQVLVGALVTLGAVTAAHLAIAPPVWSRARLPQAPAARRVEWLVPIVALDALVVTFVAVQAVALLGDPERALPSGVTYAEYARQGFAQLVVATALTLVVVGVAARRAPRTDARDRLVVRVALGVLCVATLGVVASALRRLDLYVDVFGLTRLRLLVAVAELVMGAVLVLVLVAGARGSGRWFPRAAVWVVASAVLGLAIANPDAVIVRHNLETQTSSTIDLLYLQGLSDDAAPVIDRLEEPMRSCLLYRRGEQADDDPLSWAWGRQLARDLVPTVPTPSWCPTPGEVW
ncbi:DUF4153 domain-containing protein [Cellulomonas chitinilytica]|nr:DUF4173 domain-containing protein [Cellulomonas chitinilytica]